VLSFDWVPTAEIIKACENTCRFYVLVFILKFTIMESAAKDPKDEQITNKDDSVTNKDGDNNLEKGEKQTEQNKPADEKALTPLSDNDNAPELADATASNKGQGPAGENL
jgi:hypothetical protein